MHDVAETTVKYTILLILVAFLLPVGARAHDPAVRSRICAEPNKVAKRCFLVHGKLIAANGNPTTRIWRIGTGRILDVTDEWLPPNVDRLTGVDHFATDVYGDYLVCPLTRERPGYMQFVCILRASHLTAQRKY